MPVSVRLIAKKTSTFHDFPYSSPARKCFHCWIINVTPPGLRHCIHGCIYCYAREAIYTDHSGQLCVYSNLPELVEKDLRRLKLCPPISISNVSDPCQDIPEVRREVLRLVGLLMDQGVAFAITTKGDAGFLAQLDGFAGYPLKFVAVTIEGTPDMLPLLSPGAPPFAERLASVERLSRQGVATVVRLDPAFLHLFEALHGASWWGSVERLVAQFASAGARHVVCSTGRLSRARSLPAVGAVIERFSLAAAGRFEGDYARQSTWTGNGYLLREELRKAFHRGLKRLVEEQGMTYASCQELPAAESDSAGLPHCEGLPLPFVRRGEDGRFHPVPGCTANCHVSCLGLAMPPCGRPALVTPRPLRMSSLR